MIDKVKRLCNKITEEQRQTLKAKKLDCEANLLNAEAKFIDNKKYIYINIGSSGRYMIEKSTGDIYGIKAYGVINKLHKYGNLDTVDNYFFGNYTAILK